MMGEEKQLNFCIFDPVIEATVVTGGIETTLKYIESYLDELENESEFNISLKRIDMTESELRKLRVI
jgi:hypothetical protein